MAPISSSKEYRIKSLLPRLEHQAGREYFPASKPDLHIIITSRFTERSSDISSVSIQREIYQALCASSIRNIIRILFGFNKLFYSDFQHTITSIK